MPAREGKGRGALRRDRLAIQKKRLLHGAARIMASRPDDFFRGKPRRRDDRPASLTFPPFFLEKRERRGAEV